jgi:site-specific recombinase XerD
MTVDLWAGWKAWHEQRELAPGTIEQRRYHLAMWLAHVGDRWDTAERADVAGWVAAMMGSTGPRTRRLRVSSVTCFYRWARREGHTSADPTADWENPRMQHGLPRPARWSAITRAVELEPDERVRLAIVLASACGLRRVEVARLRWDDVDVARGVVYVERGKGGKTRWAFMPPEARSMFAAHDGAGGYVFAAQSGAPVTPSYVGKLVRRALDRAEASASMHQLRHSWATRAVDGGMPLEVVAVLAGHESVDTTRIYARMATARVMELAAEHWR